MTRTRRQKSLKSIKEQRLRECPSGKASFPDRISAELFILKCQHAKKEWGARSLVRSYHCPICHNWHVTSHK